MHDVEKTPAIGISFQVGVAETKQIVFQCFVPMDCAPRDLNDALDKLRNAAERQEAYATLPKLRAQLEDFERVHRNAIEDMARLDAERQAAAEARYAANQGRRGEKMNAQQLQHEQKALADKANAETTVARAAAKIGAIKAEIAALEKKVA
jgi:hypothetical protein